jgi:hypothetical protein
VGGRRRGKGDDEFDDPAYPEPPPAQLQRFTSADQSAAAGATFGGMPAVPMPHFISQVSNRGIQADNHVSGPRRRLSSAPAAACAVAHGRAHLDRRTTR